LCDEVNDVCIPAPRVAGLEVFYAGKYSDEPDPSHAFLASGSVADSGNVTNYIHGITGVRIFFDRVVDFASTPDAALAFEWTTGMDTTFTPVTDAETVISIASAVESDVTVLTVTIDDDYVRRRWLKTTVIASEVSAAGVTLDGELTGNPVSLPSGDGPPGGDAMFYLGHVGGDADGNRQTNLTDIGIIRPEVNPFGPVPITNVYDVDKDGRVLLTDVGDARAVVNPFFVLPLVAP